MLIDSNFVKQILNTVRFLFLFYI